MIPDLHQISDEESFYIYTIFNDKVPGFGRVNFCAVNGVKWGGEDYLAIPVEIIGLSYSSNGAEITPTLNVADNKGALSRLIASYGGLEGSEVAIQKVKKRVLDTATYPLFPYRLPPDIFRIIGKVSERPDQLSYKLKNRSALKGQIPGRIINDTCSWKLYRGSGCWYYGQNGMFTVDNVPTFDPKEDKCALTKKACQLRGNYENFSGVPTVNSF